MSSIDDDRFAALTAGETNAQGLKQSGIAPTYMTGTATSNTDEDGTVSVLVDAPETASPSDEDAPTDTPVLARCWGNYVAKGERVHLMFSGGSVFVIGSGGDGGEGQPRATGAASFVPAGSDVPVVSTAATVIPGLDCDISVLAPGHLVRIEVSVHLQSGGASNTLTGRVMRVDQDGSSVEVGRFLRSSQMGNGETIQAGVPVKDFDPEPGEYTYRATVQASVTGWTLVLNPATSPLTVASMTVDDMGPLPVTYAPS